MMQAKVKQDYRWFVVQAGGEEFIKGEWRNVPEHLEAEVSNNVLLETRQPKGQKAQQGQKKPAPERASKPTAKRTSSRAKKAVTNDSKA